MIDDQKCTLHINCEYFAIRRNGERARRNEEKKYRPYATGESSKKNGERKMLRVKTFPVETAWTDFPSDFINICEAEEERQTFSLMRARVMKNS